MKRSVLAALPVLLVMGCGTTQPVGPPPGGADVPVATPTTPTAAPAQTIDITINGSAVSPSGATPTADRGQNVILVTRSDHDVTLEVQGAGIDKTVFVDRLTTITTTFVVNEPGRVLITSSDPAATIATLTVS